MTDSGIELGRKTSNALLWSYGGAVARICAQLAVQIVLARLLGPAAFGQAMLVLIVIGVGWLLAEAGFGAALVQKMDLSDQDIRYVSGSILALSVFIGGGVAIGAPSLAVWLGEPAIAGMLAFCGLVIPLQALSNVPASLMRRRLDLRRQQIVSVASYVFGYGGVGIVLAFAGFEGWSIVFGFAAQSMLVLLWGWIIVRPPIGISLRGDSRLRRFGLAVLGTNLANWVIESGDRALIGRQWGVDVVGAYGVTMNLARAPAGFLAGSTQSVALAATSRAQTELARVRGAFLAAFNLMMLVTVPFFVLLAVHAESVVTLLYGEKWRSAAGLLTVASLTMIPYAVVLLVGPMIAALGRPASEMWVQVATGILLIAALIAVASLPFGQAVWIVPAVYAFRACATLAVLSRIVHPGAGRLAKQVLAATMLALAAVSAGAAVGWALSSTIAEPLAAAASAVAIAALLRAYPRAFVQRDLARAIVVNASRSKLVAKAAAWAGMSDLDRR